MTEALRLTRGANGMFRITVARDQILWCEEEFGHSSPFNALGRMTAVQSKASSRKDLVWMVTSIVDRYRARIWTGPEHTSIEALSGRGSGGRGALDLSLFKAQLKDIVLSS